MANSQYQKLVNSTQILQELRSGSKTRTDLVNALNLQPSTVTYTLNRLKDLKLVLDSRDTSNSSNKRGRKSTQVLLNRNAGVVFGVDLLVDEFKVVFSYIDGTLFTEVNEEFDTVIITAKKGTQKRFKQCIRYVLSIIEAKCCNTKILGGCISIAGLVAFDGLTVIKSLTHDIVDVNISDCVKGKKYPIYLENDANCATMKYLQNKSDSFLYSIVRTYYDKVLPTGVPQLGVGMGIVINGKLFRGYESKAGEFVNFIYQGGKQNKQFDLDNDILTELNYNKESLKLFIDKYVDKLLFTNALLNPRTIYLGGDSKIWNEQILESVIEKYPNKNKEEIKNTFCFSFLENTENDIAYGASQLMLNFLFHMPYLNSTKESWEYNPSPLLDGI